MRSRKYYNLSILPTFTTLAFCALIISCSYSGVKARGSSPHLNKRNSGFNVRAGNLYAKLSGGETSSRRKRSRRKSVLSVVFDKSQENQSTISSCSIPAKQQQQESNDYEGEKSENASTEDVVEEKIIEKMPTVFTASRESKYDTYAACLAATEGLRRSRDATIAKIKTQKSVKKADSDKSWKSLLGFGGKMKKSGKATEDDEEYKRTCAQYVLLSTKAIHSLGMTVGQFNQIGKEVSNNDILKQKVSFLQKIKHTPISNNLELLAIIFLFFQKNLTKKDIIFILFLPQTFPFILYLCK